MRSTLLRSSRSTSMMVCPLLLAAALVAADRAGAQPDRAQPDRAGTRPSALGVANVPITLTPPTISFGAPQTPAPDLGVAGASRASGGPGARIVRLQGEAGIKAAAGLPQGARDFLILHARALPQGQVAAYVVDLDAANDFFQRHAEPASVHTAATASNDDHTGCNSVSVKCAQEAAQHAADEIKRQAQDAWKSVAGEVARDWNVVAECFSDQNLLVPDVPIQFSKTLGFPFTIGTDRNNTLASLSGTIDVGLPVDVNFRAHIGIAYIPCLPYAIRPTSIGADGTLDVGTRVSANLTAGGKFSYTAAVPPGGGVDFPITAIPVLINNNYLARLDIALYLDGQVEFDSTAAFNGTVGSELKEHTSLGFRCGGNACDLHVAPSIELIASESVRLEGRMKVRPGILAAVEISFNGDLLAARAGINPYLQGEIVGCAAAAAKQSTAGNGGADQSFALTADFDSGVEALAEAKAGPAKVGSQHWKDDQHHIAFKDLAQSTALQPSVSGKSEGVAPQPVALQLGLPSCYPYSDRVEYQLDVAADKASKTAGAATKAASVAAAGGSSGAGCSVGSDGGRCSGDPRKSTLVNLALPAPGSYSVRVSLFRDAHGRDFSGAPATQHVVTVTGAEQSAATASTAAAPNSRENPSPAGASASGASGCCVVTPNAALAGRLGRLIVAFPPSVVASGTRIEVLKDGKELQNGYGNQSWDLFAGTYELKVSGKLVGNVAVQARSDTNVRVGVLRVSASGQTRWEVVDGGTAIANGYGNALVGLPVGTYSLRISGQTESFEIRDGQVTDF